MITWSLNQDTWNAWRLIVSSFFPVSAVLLCDPYSYPAGFFSADRLNWIVCNRFFEWDSLNHTHPSARCLRVTVCLYIWFHSPRNSENSWEASGISLCTFENSHTRRTFEHGPTLYHTSGITRSTHVRTFENSHTRRTFEHGPSLYHIKSESTFLLDENSRQAFEMSLRTYPTFGITNAT